VTVFLDVALAFSFATSLRSRSISCCSGFTCPCPGKAHCGSPDSSRTPFAQYILVDIKVAGRLRHRNAPTLHQPHRLKLELAAELPFFAWQAPAS
jgi:hypothetical protein